MNGVEICQHELTGRNGGKYKIAIIRGGLKLENPKSVLDAAVSKYVDSEGYNEFVEIHLDNPWIRLILSGINELDYKPFRPDKIENVEIFEDNLTSGSGHEKCKVGVLRGGLQSETPIAFMNFAVHLFVGNQGYNEFIEIHMDNPWVRVVILGFNELIYEPFVSQRLNEKI